MFKPSDITDSDFANYFCTYGFLYHQKQMLEDTKRMRSYRDSIFLNKKFFQDKVVLDVGTGSGILAIWCAQAGARKVYAVEATGMAANARVLANANNVGHIVEVIHSTVEALELPEKVDCIISEWMGYFLLRESMLDAVIVARDKFLKPGGSLWPSHARMYVAPASTAMTHNKVSARGHALDDWEQFKQSTFSEYGVDLSALSEYYEREQTEYYMQTVQWAEVGPWQLLGKAAVILDIDLATVTLPEITEVHSKFSCQLWPSQMGEEEEEIEVSAMCGWFDVTFKGAPGEPATQEVLLCTAPEEGVCTHWGQSLFLVHPALYGAAEEHVSGTIDVTRQKTNFRLLDVCMNLQVTSGKDDATAASKPAQFFYKFE